jgi:hypothetical protein
LTLGAAGDAAQVAQTNSRSMPCPVTVPNRNPPPGETPTPTHHGNNTLWTQLWPGGTVVFKPGGPGRVLEDGSLEMKWPWWRGERGLVALEGKRLDRTAPPLRARIPTGYGDIGFQPAALVFPTPGCWEVTGRLKEATLRFVVRVEKIGEEPTRPKDQQPSTGRFHPLAAVRDSKVADSRRGRSGLIQSRVDAQRRAADQG